MNAGVKLLIENESPERTHALVRDAASLGHQPLIADGVIEVQAPVVDLIVIGRGHDDAYSLELIRKYAASHAVGVIAVAPMLDADYAAATATQGAHAFLARSGATELAAAMSIAWSASARTSAASSFSS
jgi:hypothetical protein